MTIASLVEEQLMGRLLAILRSLFGMILLTLGWELQQSIVVHTG